jgi:acetyl-CoA C-acetyltransferase
MKRVAIVHGSRTPFVKSMTNYLGFTNLDLLRAVFHNLVMKTHLDGKVLGDVVIGSVMNHPLDWNLAREVVLGSNLSAETPGMNIQRACGTGLEAINLIALKIASGQIDSGIAGGSDTNSDIPIMFRRVFSDWLLRFKTAKGVAAKIKLFQHFSPKMLIPQFPLIQEPTTGLSMGDHCELMVKEWNISREEQDRLSLESHQKAVRAYEESFYSDLIFPFNKVNIDTTIRRDACLEKLSSLKPVFDKSILGTLTAGNSTPLTDGASAVLMTSEEFAHQNRLEVMAYFKDFQVAAVDFIHGAGLLMAPTIAVSRLLERNNLDLQDFDYYEIHEAFAGQTLCTLKAWEDPVYCKKILKRDKPMGVIDRTKININGGSLALGHPFAATGGRIIASSAKLLNIKGQGRVLISICAAGGMGVAAILEK